MNDIEAIERLKALGRMFEEAPTGAIEKAIQALEKQIPRKVVHDKAHNDYKCPLCKAYIKEDEYFGYPIGEGENFCKECGQALDWS